MPGLGDEPGGGRRRAAGLRGGSAGTLGRVGTGRGPGLGPSLGARGLQAAACRSMKNIQKKFNQWVVYAEVLTFNTLSGMHYLDELQQDWCRALLVHAFALLLDKEPTDGSTR